jgi:hypothetical protein
MSEEKKAQYVEEAIAARLNDDLDRAKEMEQECFAQLRAYGSRAANAPSAGDLVDLLDDYQDYVGRECYREHYWATLRARPWEQCNCTICERSGIEVAIFRGNNRNRRRGFHNTRVFYDLLGEVLETDDAITIRRGAEVEAEATEVEVS